MRIKGIIFDLDGTLIHTIEDIVDAANRMLSSHGFPEHRVEEFIRWIGSGAARLIEAALPRGYDPDRFDDYVSEFKATYSNNLHNKSRVFEGIPEMLTGLAERKIRLAVLSNKPDKLTREVAKNYLSPWPFEIVWGQREEVPRKPDPAGAVEIAAKMELDPGEFLFVGDSVNDIKTARAAGMIPVGVAWGYGLHDPAFTEGNFHIIQKPKELFTLLN